MLIIARHLDTWPTCAVAVMTIVSDHQHTAILLPDEQGHALPIACLLLHGTHFRLLFETLTHTLLSVVDLRLICSPYQTNSLCVNSAMLYTLCLEGADEHRLSDALAN